MKNVKKQKKNIKSKISEYMLLKDLKKCLDNIAYKNNSFSKEDLVNICKSCRYKIAMLEEEVRTAGRDASIMRQAPTGW